MAVTEVTDRYYWVTACGTGFGKTQEGEPPPGVEILETREEWEARKTAHLADTQGQVIGADDGESDRVT